MPLLGAGPRASGVRRRRWCSSCSPRSARSRGRASASRDIQVVPSSSSAAATARVRVVVAERETDLGEHHVVEHLAPRGSRQAPSANARRAARAARPGRRRHDRPEAAQRGPGREAASPARELGRPLLRVARCLDQVVAVHRHRRASASGVADDGEPAVVGHVERLVRVGRPGVGVGEAATSVAAIAARRAPKARTRRRRAPRRRARGRPRRSRRRGRRRREWMLPACSTTIAGSVGRRRASPSASARIRPCVVDRDHAGSTEAEEAQRQVDRRVPLRADHDAHRRCRRPARPARRPSRPGAGRVSRAAARQVKFAIVAPVTKPTADPAGSPEQVQQPAARHLLHGGASRGEERAARRSGPRPRSASRRRGRPAGCRRSPSRRSGPTGCRPDPGSQASASRSTTSAAGVGPSGRSPRRRTISSASAPGGTGRSSSATTRRRHGPEHGRGLRYRASMSAHLAGQRAPPSTTSTADRGDIPCRPYRVLDTPRKGTSGAALLLRRRVARRPGPRPQRGRRVRRSLSPAGRRRGRRCRGGGGRGGHHDVRRDAPSRCADPTRTRRPCSPRPWRPRIAQLQRGIDDDRERDGMATTLTALLAREEQVTLAHVGDSRAYLLRAGELTPALHRPDPRAAARRARASSRPTRSPVIPIATSCSTR